MVKYAHERDKKQIPEALPNKGKYILLNIIMIAPEKIKKICTLYLATFISVVLGVAISVANSRLLGPEDFGNFRFLINIVTLAGTFFTFGFFVTGGKLLATHCKEKQQQLIGGLAIITVILSVLLIVSVFFFSYVEEAIFNNNLENYLKVICPFLFIYPLEICLQNIYQGNNRISSLALVRTIPRFIYLLTLGLSYVFFEINLWVVLLLHFVSIALVLITLFVKTKPKFTAIKSSLGHLWSENKHLGFPIYAGTLANVASNQFSGISIGFFVDMTSVGYFAIATSIAAPLQMLPSVIGTVYFKQFANTTHIPKRVILITFSIAFIALLVVLFIIEDIILALYTDAYQPAIYLSYWVIAGGILHGLGDLFNRFLLAHGRGKTLRNAAYSQGLVNILGLTGLVYVIGVNGAAYTRFCAGSVYFLYLFMAYNRYCKTIRAEPNNE